MAKRYRTVATVLDSMPSMKIFRACAPVAPGGWLWCFSVLFCKTGSAESSQEVQFLPEVDAYLKLNPNIRVSFQAKDTREGGDSTQAEIGPSMEFYLKPLVRLKEITAFDLDDAKARPLVLTAGYRYLAAPGKPGTNRIPIAVTSHLPIKAKLLLTDRNRADLDWSDGSFTWRYRNMLSLERTVAIRSYHLIPYASAEIYYESQYARSVRPKSMRALSSPWENTFSSRPTMSTRTIPANTPITGTWPGADVEYLYVQRRPLSIQNSPKQ